MSYLNTFLTVFAVILGLFVFLIYLLSFYKWRAGEEKANELLKRLNIKFRFRTVEWIGISLLFVIFVIALIITD